MNELQEHGAKLLATQERLKPIVDRWMAALGLDRWNRSDIHYKLTACWDDRPGSTTNADTWSDWTRLKFDTNFYLPTIAEMDDLELEKLVIHEFLHPLVSEMRRGKLEERTKEDYDHEERVVTTLAMCFLRVRTMALEGLLP